MTLLQWRLCSCFSTGFVAMACSRLYWYPYDGTFVLNIVMAQATLRWCLCDGTGVLVMALATLRWRPFTGVHAMALVLVCYHSIMLVWLFCQTRKCSVTRAAKVQLYTLGQSVHTSSLCLVADLGQCHQLQPEIHIMIFTLLLTLLRWCLCNGDCAGDLDMPSSPWRWWPCSIAGVLALALVSLQLCWRPCDDTGVLAKVMASVCWFWRSWNCALVLAMVSLQ